ncbi:hypothetical protein FHP05_12465 [Cerasibacillus terrae]|uniref:YppG-like protein n=2 Tax=Cerasibacillus terrae TaxID=2498845 RepID=A0A5C8NKM3_9BACI|nr:hypothetical protein FHP05_12465 [Cerasibacillus terrae]
MHKFISYTYNRIISIDNKGCVSSMYRNAHNHPTYNQIPRQGYPSRMESPYIQGAYPANLRPPVHPPFNPNEGMYHPISEASSEPHYQTMSPFTQFAKPMQPSYWNEAQMNMQDIPQDYQQEGQNIPANSILNYFNDENGQFNLDKMLSTVGQMANVYHQVSPIVKQFNALVKSLTVK